MRLSTGGRKSQAERAPRPPHLGVYRTGRLAVMFDVSLGCFCCVVHRVLVVTASQVSMVSCGLMFARFMVLCGFLVVACRVFVVFRCLVMMVCCRLRHKLPPSGCHRSNQLNFRTTENYPSRLLRAGKEQINR